MAVRPASSGGQSSEYNKWTCSLSTRSASRLVARMCACRASLTTRSANAAATPITCSQLSSTRRIFLSPIQTSEWVLALHHQPKCRCDRCRHELRIGQRSQIDEEHRVMESINQRMSDGDCYGRFSDTAGTDDADEAPHPELLRQRSNSVIAADHSR